MKLKILFIAISVLVFSNSYAENHIIALKVEKMSQAEAEKMYKLDNPEPGPPGEPGSPGEPIYSQAFKVNVNGEIYSFLPYKDIPGETDGCRFTYAKNGNIKGGVNFTCEDVKAMSFFLRKENKSFYILAVADQYFEKFKKSNPGVLVFTFHSIGNSPARYMTRGEIGGFMDDNKAKTIAEGKKYFNLYFDKHPNDW